MVSIHLFKFKSVISFPKCLKTRHLLLLIFFTSMLITIHCDPNSLAAFFINSGLLIAAEFITTLSAPALSLFFISSKVLIFPPIDKGTLHILDKSLIISIKFSWLFCTTADLDEEDPITFLLFSNPWMT